MKQNIFINLINSLKAFSTRARQKDDEKGVEFSQILTGELKKEDSASQTRRSQQELAYSEKQETRKTEKESSEKETKESAPGSARELTEFELSPLLNYLYNLVYKSPDTLSLGQKKAFGFEKEPDGEIGIKELEKFLKQRGIKLTELDSNQLRQLVQRGNKSSVIAFLDDFIKQRLGEEKEAVLSFGGVEKAKEAKPSLFDKAKTSPTLQKEEVIKQIIDHIKIQNLARAKEVTIRLNPEYLGEVKVKIYVEGNRTSVEFKSASKEVGRIISENINELKTALEDQGLKTDELKIS